MTLAIARNGKREPAVAAPLLPHLRLPEGFGLPALVLAIALLLGGPVRGGRVIADWPGLADGQLYEARDLRPTLDLRAVLKGVLRDHLGLPRPAC